MSSAPSLVPRLSSPSNSLGMHRQIPLPKSTRVIPLESIFEALQPLERPLTILERLLPRDRRNDGISVSHKTVPPVVERETFCEEVGVLERRDRSGLGRGRCRGCCRGFGGRHGASRRVEAGAGEIWRLSGAWRVLVGSQRVTRRASSFAAARSVLITQRGRTIAKDHDWLA
jgi:hypothetical protein